MPDTCPDCAIPEVPTDDKGKIILHGRWYNDPNMGPSRLRSYCTSAVGKTPERKTHA